MGKKIVPVIMCGGSGSRLWPLSRQSFPKQFLKLTSSKNSLLQKTQLRLNKLVDISSPILICNEVHRFIVAEQMREINIKPFSILLEPFAKNTAPAITLAALKALEIEDDKDPILLVLSSDHEIKNEEKFLEVLNAGLEFALKNRLVTFGIIPDSPHIGYGYIKAENPLNRNKISGENIIKFTEKPDLETAKIFLKDKRYTWNSGIFLFKAKTIINELNKYVPDVISCCKSSINKSQLDLDFERINEEEFNKCPEISIDFSVMEKTDKGTVLPLDAGWSDIGSWESLWEISPKDKDGNHINGRVINHSSINCFLKSEKRLLVGIGLNNLIAVETNDATLVADKAHSQKVKEVVNILKNKEMPEGLNHSTIYRPWGSYITIAEDSRWQVKMIEVKPKGKLSLQMHHHRAEHWVVVKGRAQVEIENQINFLSENQSTYIPLGKKHRLSNPGKIPLIIIEIQSGSYVGEDDIVRFEDVYGRAD
tara:strand:- start:559 stop:1998 length:1440 start_codon:yes stop_codon:yes gene_type:complete